MSGPSKSRIDPSIIAAFIGVCGTVVVALLSLIVPRMLPQEATPIPSSTSVVMFTPTITDTAVPTDTVPAGDPTSTPAPATLTPEPTFTPAAPAIGADWRNGCISALWKPWPETVQPTATNGCLSEPVNLFFAVDGRLTFLTTGRFAETQVYGMFAPLPANGTVSIKSFLRNLQDGEIWMGVFSEPNIESQGMVIVIPPGDVKKRLLVQKIMPGQTELQRTQQFQQDPPVYDVVFDISNGAVSVVILQGTVLNSLPVNSAQPWLFVGYQVKKGNNRIDAEFLDLVVQPR
jgi:hypothetical protein